MPGARPNLALNSDPTCAGWFPLSWLTFLGSVHRAAAGWAGNLLSLGRPTSGVRSKF